MKTELTDEEQAATAMGKLLEAHGDLVEVPELGEILTGHILDKAHNAMYLDLGSLGVGVIYGRELYDDLDTYKNAKIGDPVQATIEDLENDDGYVELSLRAATRERSWEELRRKLTDGDIFEAEILDANKGGLIVRVNGVMGFLPVSQLAPDHYPRVDGGDKNQILERLKSYMSEKFKVKVITAVQDEEKLIVSEKAAIGDQLSETLNKLTIGSEIDGIVSGVADFGAFVKFELDGQELEGLVHISELAWQRIDDPADIVSVGEKVAAKVIGVEGLRISLSIKQLKSDPWESVADRYHINDVVKGEVLKVTAFGGFVKLDNDIHGLVHISELPKESQSEPESVLKIGEMVEFKIISLEPSEHRLGLSLTAMSSKKNPEKSEDLGASTEKSAATSAKAKADKEEKESDTPEEDPEKSAEEETDSPSPKASSSAKASADKSAKQGKEEKEPKKKKAAKKGTGTDDTVKEEKPKKKAGKKSTKTDDAKKEKPKKGVTKKSAKTTAKKSTSKSKKAKK